MRIKDGFVLREVAGSYMVIATGEASKSFHGMIRLNLTGAEIWKGISDGLDQEQIADKLMEKYEDVSREKVMGDIHKIITQMKEAGFFAE